MTTYLLPYTAGTAATNGTTTITGTLTAWLANVKPGDPFTNASGTVIIESVESNTSMTATETIAAASGAYRVDRWSRGWFSGGDLALALALYNTNRPTFIPTTGKPSDAVGADGNVAFDASANIFYKKSSGAWDNGTSIVGLPGEITRSGAQTGGMARFVSDTEIGEATPEQAANIIGSARELTFNLFEDAGRFAGTPEPQGTSAPTFTAPTYLTNVNGASIAQGDKFIFNNTTYGGTAGALGADVDGLIQKIKDTAASATYGRYGPEFYVANVTAGSGTASSRVVGGTTYYLMLNNATVPLWGRSTLGFNVKVKSGGLAMWVNNVADTYLDGVKQTADFALTSADGWKQIVRRFTYDPRQFIGYDSTLLRLYATPGSVIAFALPFLVPARLPENGATPYGAIPSLTAWR